MTDISQEQLSQIMSRLDSQEEQIRVLKSQLFVIKQSEIQSLNGTSLRKDFINNSELATPELKEWALTLSKVQEDNLIKQPSLKVNRIPLALYSTVENNEIDKAIEYLNLG